jgi:nitrogen fixation/metabolism regulation signal transduction histidine kinase
MSLKRRYILFGSLFFLSYGLILFEVLRQNKWMFLMGEILLVGMILLFALFYRQLLKPIQSISSGISLLKEKNFSTYLRKVGQKEVDGIVEVYNQMVEELRQERVQKEERNHFLDQLLDASPVGIIILDLKERILQTNPAALQQLQVDDSLELQGRMLRELDHPLARKLALINTPSSSLIQLDGMSIYQVHRRYFMDKGFRRAFYVVEELTREWVRFEKKSYEKVIRTMSHEVNNTVGSINSVLHSLTELHKDKDDEASRDIREALEASIERNSNLNRFMANYASVVKIPDPSLQHLDINKLVDKVLVLFDNELRNRSVQVEKDLCPSMPEVQADRPQMEQVLVNVVKNSMEAMDGCGELRVETSARPLRLRVMDNGRGLSPATKDKIFTPFYSDKKNGQGIGLTLIREVLTAHRFSFSLATNRDGWTEFVIHFDGET